MRYALSYLPFAIVLLLVSIIQLGSWFGGSHQTDESIFEIYRVICYQPVLLFIYYILVLISIVRICDYLKNPLIASRYPNRRALDRCRRRYWLWMIFLLVASRHVLICFYYVPQGLSAYWEIMNMFYEVLFFWVLALIYWFLNQNTSQKRPELILFLVLALGIFVFGDSPLSLDAFIYPHVFYPNLPIRHILIPILFGLMILILSQPKWSFSSLVVSELKGPIWWFILFIVFSKSRLYPSIGYTSQAQYLEDLFFCFSRKGEMDILMFGMSIIPWILFFLKAVKLDQTMTNMEVYLKTRYVSINAYEKAKFVYARQLMILSSLTYYGLGLILNLGYHVLSEMLVFKMIIGVLFLMSAYGIYWLISQIRLLHPISYLLILLVYLLVMNVVIQLSLDLSIFVICALAFVLNVGIEIMIHWVLERKG